MNADLSIDPDKKRKVDKLERLIVTHNDDDHTTYVLKSPTHLFWRMFADDCLPKTVVQCIYW